MKTTKQKIETETFLGKNGEIRWNTNKSCVPMDIFRDAKCTPPASQQKEIDIETSAFLADYVSFRETNGYTAEEKAEIRANLGGSAIDVITGKKIF